MEYSKLPKDLPIPEDDGGCKHLINSNLPEISLPNQDGNDYTKFTDYQMYTALPFGRIVRDIFQPDQGLIDNPGRLLEKMAGMPMRDVQRFTAQRKKDIEEGKRFKQPKVGW